VQHLVLRLLLKDYEAVCVVSVSLGLGIVAFLTLSVEICKLAKKIFYTVDLGSCPIRRLEVQHPKNISLLRTVIGCR
jgi:hypothetical protein